jgi:hypothetical protein
MRRTRLAVLLPVLTTLAVATSAGAAEAQTFNCFPGTPQQFTVLEKQLVNREKTVQLADGSPIPGGFVAQSSNLGPPFVPNRTTGSFVVSYTNQSTNKVIVANISGPTWVTFDPTPTVPGALATGTEVATGNNGNSFASLSLANVGGSALKLTSGLIIIHFEVLPDGTFVATSFSTRGRQVDGCALLAG